MPSLEQNLKVSLTNSQFKNQESLLTDSLKNMACGQGLMEAAFEATFQEITDAEYDIPIWELKGLPPDLLRQLYHHVMTCLKETSSLANLAYANVIWQSLDSVFRSSQCLKSIASFQLDL